jgi:hypothetical protein
MKKILVLSAVLFGAVTASQAGVLQDIGVSVRLPFLLRVVVRPPAPVFMAPPPVVAYAAPQQVCPPSVTVCPPAPVVRVPAYAPAPVYRGEGRAWHGRPERDFRHDDRGWGHERDDHHRR